MTQPQQNEIRILKKLRHPHVVSYLNFIKDGDNLHIVLEFVESGSMHDVIKKFGILAESLIQIYTRQVLDGLAFLHAEGVIHRDLKGEWSLAHARSIHRATNLTHSLACGL